MTDAFDYPADREEASAAQVRALEALLIEKGVIAAHTVDKVLGYFESEMTPLNGQKIVARAWTDPEFADLLVSDTPAAVAQLDLPVGMAGPRASTWRPCATSPACTTWSSAPSARASPGRSSDCRRTGTRTRSSGPAPLVSPVSC
jgi:nitrile hydratase